MRASLTQEFLTTRPSLQGQRGGLLLQLLLLVVVAQVVELLGVVEQIEKMGREPGGRSGGSQKRLSSIV